VDGDLVAALAEVSDSRVKELRTLNDRLQRKLANEQDRTARLQESIFEAMSAAIAGLDIPPVPPPAKDARKKGEETAVLLLSDWQLGKRTPTYSSDVCAERVELLQEKVTRLVEIQRADHPVKRIAVMLLGDMIEGELIFPGQAHQIDSSLFRQVAVDGPKILGGLVRWASANFEKVDVHAVPGNHGHIGGRSWKEMNPESNGDRMLYQISYQLTEGLRNVKWNVSLDWFQVADLGEKCRFLLLHGDQVRGWAGIPWYGWMRKVLAWGSLSRLWPEMEFDHIAAGHFHTPVSMYINGRRLWVNASTESHNPYALEQLAAAGEPAQWLLFVKPGQGVTAEYLVSLA
jgi:hypothetical protein